MRFFVQMVERAQADSQEVVAMLRHRMKSLDYQSELLESGVIAYAFRTQDGSTAILMYELDSLEKMDRYLKRDPGWPYADTDVMPVISTEHLVREAQEYLDIEIFSEGELPRLNFKRKPIDPQGEYWLAYKEVRPFNPLLSEEEQNEVHRRTILAQEAHFAPVEFADDNPVGKAVGILVGEGPLEEVRGQVEQCDVFPDTIVTYTRLLPLQQAFEQSEDILRRMKRTFDRPHRFER